MLHYFKTYEIFIPPELQSNPAFAKALGQHNALKLEISQKLHDLEKKQIDRGETKVLEDKV